MTDPALSTVPGSRLAERRRRTHSLRRRTLAAGCSVFAAVWVGIFARMAAGHDPVLAAASTPPKAAAPATSAPPVAASDPGLVYDPNSGGYVESSPQSLPPPEPMTTGQS
jgi:hypothetical protein